MVVVAAVSLLLLLVLLLLLLLLLLPLLRLLLLLLCVVCFGPSKGAPPLHGCRIVRPLRVLMAAAPGVSAFVALGGGGGIW